MSSMPSVIPLPSIPLVTYIGIDPGKQGGMCALNSDTIEYTPMPYTERDIWKWMERVAKWQDGSCKKFAVIESVHSMPTDGRQSAFKFGTSYGMCKMALTAVDIPYVEREPTRWMRALQIQPRKKGESKIQWKNRLKGIAQQLYPEENVTLKVADAILLATYAYLWKEGKL